MITEAHTADRRLLFLAATGRDASTATSVLSRVGIEVETCRTFDELIGQLGVGAGAVLLPEEAASTAHLMAFRQVLNAQPPWSDLPVLVLARQGADSAESDAASRLLGNVTLIERPVRQATLITAVQTAIRARDRQYQMREHLAQRARAEEALRAADQRKDEFLATLGHELRNPLAPLLTALQLLKASVPSDPLTVRVSAVMERQITHLTRLVNDLLEVSRITRGLIDIRRDRVDLAFVVHSAVDTSRPVVDDAGHHLHIDVPSEPVTVHGDPIRLTQVFANLITNAAKYTNAGGHIAIRVRRDGPRAIVSVRDDGIGLAEDQLAPIFDMFTQVDRSNRRAQGGLGIGLTLVRSLITMHGGRVEARSAGLGHGSEFIVELPAIAARPSAAVAPPVPAAFPAQRILIVDDNRDAAEMLGDLLRQLGATVAVVHSGLEAFDLLDTFSPAAVLLDIGMPGMDGYEVARVIRSTPRHAAVLLIALTGWGQEHDRQRARAAGFDHHMVKPPDIELLRGFILAGRVTAPRG